MRRFFAVLLICALAFSVPTLVQSAPPETVSVLVGFSNPAGHRAVAAAGGRVQREFGFINAALVELPDVAIDKLAANPAIRYVELNQPVYALAQTLPWGIDRVNAPDVHAQGHFGTGIKVAIIDTGIKLNHEDLTVWGGYNAMGGSSYADDHGHGTHVAGTVAALNNSVGVIGAAPAARLYAVKVLDSGGSGTLDTVIGGIEWAYQNGMQVINMSLGASSGSQALEAACNAAYNAGILVVAAAGNEGNIRGNRESIGYPANYASVIAVGSTTSIDTRSSFSSTGANLELMAPGSSILSTTYNGGYGTMSGTSMASPHVAGVAALIWSVKTNLTNVQLRQILNDTANDLWNDPFRYGNGLVDAWAAYQFVSGGGDPGDPGDPTALNVSLVTDKTTYTLRQTIYATVTVTDENNAAVSGAAVNLNMVTASGRTYNYSGTTGSDGKVQFSCTTKVPDGSGQYTLTATASVGNVTGSATTTVQVN